MQDKKQLNLYWGTQDLYFVETQGSNVTNYYKTALMAPNANAINTSSVPASMQTINVIQEVLKKKNASQTTVNLSLPSKDIIFRSFIIPWMQSSEIKGVVNFEASKYVPFVLDDLSYRYHAMNITDGGNKRIRVIFVAIKKETLDQYKILLEQVGLSLDQAEPEALSLVRSLVFKNLVPSNQLCAVIGITDSSGKIIIVNQGAPQFVREFKLKTQDENDPIGINAHIINEIRISLDYFNRQDRQLQVKNIFVHTNNDQGVIEKMGKELGVSVSAINMEHIINQAKHQPFDFVNAYGVGIADLANYPINFDFVRQQRKTTKKSININADSSFNIKLVAGAAALSVMILIISFFIAQNMSKNNKSKLSDLLLKIGDMKDVAVEKIQEKNTLKSNKLNYFKNLRIKSDLGKILAILPNLLPEGTWIKDLDIDYSTSNTPVKIKKKDKNGNETSEITRFVPTLVFSGYAYLENVQGQFKLVNQIITNLNSNAEFSSFFNKISLENISADRLNDINVTSFKIKCR